MSRRGDVGGRRGALVALVASAACALGAEASCTSFRDTEAGAPGGDGGADSPLGAGDAHGDDDASPASDADVADAAGNPESGGSGDAGSSVCTAATCPVTTLLSNLYGPAALATDATYVYWLEVGTQIPQADSSGEFVRLRKDATCTDRSCVEVLDPFALSGTFENQLIYDNLVAVNADDACYAQSYNAQSEHSIFCFPLASLDKVSIDQDYGDCDGLWAGPASMVWSLASTSGTTSDGAIRVHPLTASDGGAAPLVAGARPNPTSVLADGTGVVWTETGLGDAGGAVFVTAVDGGATPLATGRRGPVAVAEYAGYVYWIDADARTVSRIARAGGGAIDQIANTDVNPFALAVDATGVYWASGGLTTQDGSVSHAPLGPGGPSTVMLSNVLGIQAMAVDTARVYVAALGSSVNGGGSIVSIAKAH